MSRLFLTMACDHLSVVAYKHICMTQQAHRPSFGRRPSRSRYAIQLREKQSLKNTYGIREEQLRKYFSNAHRSGGQTGRSLITLLERRLDNAVFRAGMAQSRSQARQMTSHRFFSINGRPVNIPSHPLKKDDVISIREQKRSTAFFSNFEKRMQNSKPPSWILLDSSSWSFKITQDPMFEEANVDVNVQAVVEFFAR